MNEKMTFFASYYTAIMKIDNPSDRLKAFEAICGYGITGKISKDLDGVASIVFDLTKPNIDTSMKRRTAGEKGGRPCAFDNSETKSCKTENQNKPLVLQNIKPNDELAFTNTETDKDKDKEEDKDKDKECSKKSPRTQVDIVNESDLPDPVKEKLIDWLAYKKEKREGYKETGLKALISEVMRHVNEDGQDAVIGLINESMANGWKGIIWDRLKQPRQSVERSGTSEKIHSFEERKPDFSDLERKLIKNL